MQTGAITTAAEMPASEPDTTTEPQPQAYTPPEGWRLLAVGETLQEGDEIVQSDDARRYPTERVGSVVGANHRYIRRIEQPQPEPQAEPEPIRVREGRWKTRGGMVRDITPTPSWHPLAELFPWCDHYALKTWRDDGRYDTDEHPEDLVNCINPTEPQPQPEPEPQAEPEPIRVREGRWRTRNGEIRNVTPTPEGDERKERWPWFNAQYRETWRANGRYHFGEESVLDLVTYLGPIETETQPQLGPPGPSVLHQIMQRCEAKEPTFNNQDMSVVLQEVYRLRRIIRAMFE